MGELSEVGIDVRVDVSAPETAAWAWEAWLRRHLVDRLPGGKARS
jgi:hypothetical protein